MKGILTEFPLMRIVLGQHHDSIRIERWDDVPQSWFLSLRSRASWGQPFNLCSISGMGSMVKSFATSPLTTECTVGVKCARRTPRTFGGAMMIKCLTVRLRTS